MMATEAVVERLVKSAERVRDLAEVFTPAETVDAMLDLLPSAVWSVHPSATFLEPACGDGNFLVAIPSGLAGLGVNAAFGGQGLAAELYFSGSDGERNLRRMRSLREQRERFEAHYGAELEWQELDGRLSCRVVEYLEDVDIFEEHRWDEYRAWVIDRHTRLRHAIEELGGTARAVGEG